MELKYSNHFQANTRKIVDNVVKIDYRFKILYSISMICVILGHLYGKGSIELNIHGWFPYRSFHMPLFIFSSGYFFKIKNVFNTLKYISRKFGKLILPIYSYNFFYGFLIYFSKKYSFINNIKPFSFINLFIEPFGGSKILFIGPSWFSSTLFFVESYNILKRRIIKLLKIEPNELIYLIFDLYMSYKSISFSNKGYNKIKLYKCILRIMHLNIYYEIGILFNKYLESHFNKIKNDVFFVSIFAIKLIFHLYYSKMPEFQYSKSEYYNYSPFTVITNSVLGILFWVRISQNIEPILGKNFYINVIANNTFSIMMNHFFSNFMIRNIFAIISKNTKYFKDFDFNRHYSNLFYIYLPNNIISAGIIYFLGSLIFPILIQKAINKIKLIIFINYSYFIKKKRKNLLKNTSSCEKNVLL